MSKKPISNDENAPTISGGTKIVVTPENTEEKKKAGCCSWEIDVFCRLCRYQNHGRRSSLLHFPSVIEKYENSVLSLHSLPDSVSVLLGSLPYWPSARCVIYCFWLIGLLTLISQTAFLNILVSSCVLSKTFMQLCFWLSIALLTSLHIILLHMPASQYKICEIIWDQDGQFYSHRWNCGFNGFTRFCGESSLETAKKDTGNGCLGLLLALHQMGANDTMPDSS